MPLNIDRNEYFEDVDWRSLGGKVARSISERKGWRLIDYGPDRVVSTDVEESDDPRGGLLLILKR